MALTGVITPNLPVTGATIDLLVFGVISLSLVSAGWGFQGNLDGPAAIIEARGGHSRAFSRRTRFHFHCQKEISLTSQDVVETRILKGAALARSLRAEIAAAKVHLNNLGCRPPVLASLLVGDNAAALAYRSSIDRTFRKAEVEHRHVELPATTTPDDFVTTVEQLNADPSITGILVFMPLPDQLDPHLILEHLSPLKDVDGITPTNAGRLHLGLPSLRPSTPAGGLELLDHSRVELDGTRVTVIGRSNVVGRPLATLLTQRNATVTLCHRHTVDLAAETLGAEVICVAAGAAGLVTREMVSRGAIVIDFGVNVAENGKIVGDTDFDGLLGHAGAITPVPGGTGPVTALVLARNTLAAGFAARRGTLDDVLFDLPEALLRAAEASQVAN
jgi:methylenetetrahydrofolate dehydrogenase (NADP+)/methenyltetrahydrofolate cyclohydrolase